jgi:hypothetical protein
MNFLWVLEESVPAGTLGLSRSRARAVTDSLTTYVIIVSFEPSGAGSTPG